MTSKVPKHWLDPSACIHPRSRNRHAPVRPTLVPAGRQRARLQPPVAFRPDNVQGIPQRDGAITPARIRCPHCQWQPPRSSRWFCTDMGAPENFTGGCGHGWNTFDTRGTCPGCSYQWVHTWCLQCGKPALHDDWYVGGGQP